MMIDFRTEEQARQEMKFTNHENRLATLLSLRYRIDDDVWLTLLGEEWSGCDNIGLHHDDLYDSPFGDRIGSGPIFEMMTPDALSVFRSLPEEVVIFRGCYGSNKWGWSWSLNIELAKGFPTLNRYRRANDTPLLVKAWVRKADILAVIMDRDETEIVTTCARHISTSKIRLLPMAA